MSHRETAIVATEGIDPLILTIRGQRVMLDSDLARIYGVTTKRLKEQFGRNVDRFPKDFAFELTSQEFANLRSQNATSTSHGGSRYLPVVFTEHGALMLASVLHSPTAVEASVRVVRAFVRMRELLSLHRELSQKLFDLENRLDDHDEAIQRLFEAIRHLLEPPSGDQPPREIGFHIHEEPVKYRVRRPVKTR